MIRYKIHLTQEEVDELRSIVKKGYHTSKTFRAAYILLNSDEGPHNGQKVINEEISKVLRVSMRTIDRVKKQFLEEGLEACLSRRPTSRIYDRKVDGDTESKLVTLCCSSPPEGYSQWSYRLLADKMVELEYVDDISHETVRRVLKKTNLSLGKSKNG